MKLTFLIFFVIYSIALLGMTGLSLMQSSDFKYFSKGLRKVAFVFAFFIMLFYIASVIMFSVISTSLA